MKTDLLWWQKAWVSALSAGERSSCRHSPKSNASETRTTLSSTGAKRCNLSFNKNHQDPGSGECFLTAWQLAVEHVLPLLWKSWEFVNERRVPADSAHPAQRHPNDALDEVGLSLACEFGLLGNSSRAAEIQQRNKREGRYWSPTRKMICWFQAAHSPSTSASPLIFVGVYFAWSKQANWDLKPSL